MKRIIIYLITVIIFYIVLIPIYRESHYIITPGVTPKYTTFFNWYSYALIVVLFWFFLNAIGRLVTRIWDHIEENRIR